MRSELETRINLNDRNVIVTGGTGFIGSHLVRELLAHRAYVYLVTRYGNVAKHPRLADIWSQLNIVEADIRNRGALEQISDIRPRYVFHLAAYNHVGQSFTQVEECYDVNAKGTANLIDASIHRGLENFVYISSSEVYGKQDKVPWVESMHPRPQSPYAITKYAGELYALMKQKIGDPVVVVRPFNVFGPDQSTKAIIPELILKCLRGDRLLTTLGEQTREFNFISNIISGLILASQSKFDGPINLASGFDIKIAQLVRMIAKLTKSRSRLEIGALRYRPNELWRMQADNARAREILNWKPLISFEEGLRKTIDWYRSKEKL